MTSAQMADFLGVTENHLKKNWNKLKESYEKRGFEIVKLGRGETAEYGFRRTGDTDFRF